MSKKIPMMNKKQKAKAYFLELKKLIKKCPKGYHFAYDNQKCQIYLVPDNCEFVDHPYTTPPAMLITVGGNYTPTKSEDEGNMIIVDNGIDINLEAVSCNAKIELENE